MQSTRLKLLRNGYMMERGHIGHPSSPREGTVHQHHLVVERALGHYLRRPAEVHHVNGVRTDNVPGNLVACQDHEYHRLLHVRSDAYDACGHADWRKCPYCGAYDDPAHMVVHARKKNLVQLCHRACRNAARRERYLTGAA